jgi:hypothetical protein
VAGGIVLPPRLEAGALIGGEQAVHLHPGCRLDGVERGLDSLHDTVHAAVACVEQRIEDGSLLRGDPDVVVELRTPLRRRQLILPKNAVGGEAEDAADEQGAEEEGESLLLGALDGWSVCVRMLSFVASPSATDDARAAVSIEGGAAEMTLS